ncbi:hypothetical protein PICMEDRAFT_52477 [Pichia membranifaciens NRRL Y-2026]|uniref:Major facilitator superfamily (MFS) profile domain-containing protein n=1 Tax=Pichia membranifaciens NRRL Y-2026 TaxID=763406 RepID=A0A1E3NM69_9ASCO|nr:hypothetical protein PICMEDRAFT_52477 [Pichia membranifaciens NRRL Y-2026]ODQ46678.1 hypothetical protein PICMEDRAFT_52477 [Pichia membranifaciens NRRL Y-2026]
MTHIFLSLKQSSRDIRLLWFSVFIRMISFGLTNQVLTLYLKEIGISEVNIGLFMSLTMIGDSVISYALTWNANKIGNRFIMLMGSFLMMVASGIFSTGTSNFGYLLVAAIVGVISPSGNDAGPFKTIEETVLANLTPPNHRPEVYAIHWTLGSIGASLGSFLAGLSVDYFTHKRLLPVVDSYRYTFCILVFTSFLKFVSLLFVSYKAEPSYVPPYMAVQHDQDSNIEDATIEHETLTGLSPQSQSILFKLMVPFMLDSFGNGFMTNAWVVYYFKERYKTPAVLLGTLFGLSGIAMSVSAIPSAWFAKQFGPIKSSVMTQIPCGLFFMMIPILGFNFSLGSLFYLLNQMTTAFDVVPRQIILTTLVEPTDLSKVMGSVNIGKQIARSISPYFTGYFAEAQLLWVCFLITGVLLIIANLILAIDFSDLDEKVREIEQVQHDIM